MKILVTGSEGFIGKYLVRRLLDDGHTVRGMDIRVQGDVRLYRHCLAYSRGADVVMHLAALVDVGESIEAFRKASFDYHDTNVTGSINMLTAAVANQVKRFIYISSAAAGDPISPYGAQKLAVEGYCGAFEECYGLQVVALRPFNVYGRGNGKGVIDKWITAIRNGERPVINGGNQSRDFIYVKDVVNYIIFQIISTRN
jgi:nucleoside-diphosphate-sugar epimerase